MTSSSKACFEEMKAGQLLPSPKGVALAILEATQRTDTSIVEVTRLVQVDPALTGRILRYANAALGGAVRHIASLSHAITFLGLFRIRQIVLGLSLIDQYRSGKCPAFDYTGYWTTSLATAIAAQKLAVSAQSPPDESFTCGLLSGIGRLGLATAFPEQYSAILANYETPDEISAAEIESFGIDHAQLSAEMLESWGLPGIFADAVRYHENLAKNPSAPGTRAFALSATLSFAAQIGQLLNLDSDKRWGFVPSLYNTAAQIGLEENELPPLIESIAQGWQDWTRELKLPSKNYSDIRELLAAPAADFNEAASSSLTLSQLGVTVFTENPVLRKRLAQTLSALKIRHHEVRSIAQLQERLANAPTDLLILDLGESIADVVYSLNSIRRRFAPRAYIITLIPARLESGVAQLLAAGATDYLDYDFSESALMARLTNIQRLLSLQAVVRSERELAVSASGNWARSNRRLLQDALTDVLTQLPNRRYGMDRFEQEWSVAASNNLPISCMMLDIDHFKRVNDERGHHVGDAVLRQVAKLVEQYCRRSDVVFRYGGEEFCCICPATTEKDAILLAERLVDVIRNERFGLSGKEFPLTLSIGVAERTGQLKQASELIAAADKALYLAKESGRNRVCVHRDE